MKPDTQNNPFAHLIACIKADGLATASKKLDFIYREMIWVNDSDFIGAFGAEMVATKERYWHRMSGITKESFDAVTDRIRMVFPELNL